MTTHHACGIKNEASAAFVFFFELTLNLCPGKVQMGTQWYTNTESSPGAVLLLSVPPVPSIQHPSSLPAVHAKH